MNESCLIWLSYVSYDWVLSVMNESFSLSICSVWVCVFVGHVDMLSHAGILLKVQWQVAVWRPFNTLQRTANPWHHTTPTTPTRTSGASNEAKDRVPALNSIGCLLDSILHHKSIWLRNKLFLAPAPWGFEPMVCLPLPLHRAMSTLSIEMKTTRNGCEETSKPAWIESLKQTSHFLCIKVRNRSVQLVHQTQNLWWFLRTRSNLEVNDTAGNSGSCPKKGDLEYTIISHMCTSNRHTETSRHWQWVYYFNTRFMVRSAIHRRGWHGLSPENLFCCHIFTQWSGCSRDNHWSG